MEGAGDPNIDMMDTALQLDPFPSLPQDWEFAIETQHPSHEGRVFPPTGELQRPVYEPGHNFLPQTNRMGYGGGPEGLSLGDPVSPHLVFGNGSDGGFHVAEREGEGCFNPSFWDTWPNDFEGQHLATPFDPSIGPEAPSRRDLQLEIPSPKPRGQPPGKRKAPSKNTSSASSSKPPAPSPSCPPSSSIPITNRDVRDNHNQIERRYRTTLNQKFEVLRCTLPKKRAEKGEVGKEKKMSKSDILVGAMGYIKELEERGKELVEANRVLEGVVGGWEREWLSGQGGGWGRGNF